MPRREPESVDWRMLLNKGEEKKEKKRKRKRKKKKKSAVLGESSAARKRQRGEDGSVCDRSRSLNSLARGPCENEAVGRNSSAGRGAAWIQGSSVSESGSGAKGLGSSGGKRKRGDLLSTGNGRVRVLDDIDSDDDLWGDDLDTHLAVGTSGGAAAGSSSSSSGIGSTGAVASVRALEEKEKKKDEDDLFWSSGDEDIFGYRTAKANASRESHTKASAIGSSELQKGKGKSRGQGENKDKGKDKDKEERCVYDGWSSDDCDSDHGTKASFRARKRARTETTLAGLSNKGNWPRLAKTKVAFLDSRARALELIAEKPAGPLRCCRPTEDMRGRGQGNRDEDTGSATHLECVLTERVNKFLKPFQREGVAWMFKHFAAGQGMLLGDDMGCGKTVQVVSLLIALFAKTGVYVQDTAALRLRRERASNWLESARARQRQRCGGDAILLAAEEAADVLGLPDREGALLQIGRGMPPVLVVAPSSVLDNWSQELRTWGCFEPYIFGGDSRIKREALVKAKTGEAEVVICSHGMLRENVGDLNRIKWSAVVFDEIHQMKNPKSALCKAARELGCYRKIGLTGTLFQNSHLEPFHICETLRPGAFGNLSTYKENIVKPIKWGRKKTVGDDKLSQAKKARTDFNLMLGKMYLRRTKEDVLKGVLKKKSDNIVYCTPAPVQLKTYDIVRNLADVQLLIRGDEPCDCGRGPKPNKRKKCCYQYPTPGEVKAGLAPLWNFQHPDGIPCKNCPNCILLPAMTKLSLIANHLELIKPSPLGSNPKREETQKYEKDKAFAEAAFQCLPAEMDVCGGREEHLELIRAHRAKIAPEGNYKKLVDPTVSGKMQMLGKVLNLAEKKHKKVLVFSGYTRMLEILKGYCKGCGYKYAYLDGSTKQSERQSLVESFNNESSCRVFLISTLAGGTGLNLTSASIVVIFEPQWNPAHDMQAMDRAFRIGQTEDVTVYRFLTRGMIEEMRYLRQVYKQQLKGEEEQGKSGGRSDKRGHEARRLFEAVEGDKAHRGQLFGMANLLRLEKGEGGFLALIDKRRGSSGVSSGNEEIDAVPSAMDWNKVDNQEPEMENNKCTEQRERSAREARSKAEEGEEESKKKKKQKEGDDVKRNKYAGAKIRKDEAQKAGGQGNGEDDGLAAAQFGHGNKTLESERKEYEFHNEEDDNSEEEDEEDDDDHVLSFASGMNKVRPHGALFEASQHSNHDEEEEEEEVKDQVDFDSITFAPMINHQEHFQASQPEVWEEEHTCGTASTSAVAASVTAVVAVTESSSSSSSTCLHLPDKTHTTAISVKGLPANFAPSHGPRGRRRRREGVSGSDAVSHGDKEFLIAQLVTFMRKARNKRTGSSSSSSPVSSDEAFFKHMSSLVRTGRITKHEDYVAAVTELAVFLRDDEIRNEQTVARARLRLP